MIRIEGLVYDGRSSRAVPATLECNAEGELRLLGASGEGLAISSEGLGDIRVSSRLGDTPRYLYFSGGEKFETGDNDSVDRMLVMQRQGSSLGWVSTMERSWRYVLLSTALVVLVSWWGVRDGVPLVAQWVAQALPAEVSHKIGSGTLELLDSRVFSPSELSADRQRQLRGYFAPLVARYPELPLQLEFRRGNGLGANALALPSGVIVFTDELVALSDRDEQLLGVMAHEIGHIARRHTLRSVVQSSMMSLALVAITGDVSAASSVLVAAPTLLLELSYSREFEHEADQFAVVELKALGVSPSHLADMISRLEQSDGGAEGDGPLEAPSSSDRASWRDYLSTHPRGGERLELIAD
ncbi:M48 family metallopeptidase [Aestuariirhabdus litorea]|uniref:Peptidase M48 Ste24p n=1 Tax=Aestuariirhabdus litorea TaxID=2528527 RepID=A0A3P3VQQ6_9GAMM|nr:M48 family metallopeptidase [Aestuariirhabdus litorea]RRJ85065.1 peptidase M48 Ste24p [Aestuariirhabdus litorea]RWW98290.1 M48 family metallopeptidase [Endozoicomonadaceae bacterium GTF-13]